MGKGSAPSAPDPYASAAAQYQYGTQAANYNMGLNAVNEVGPTGSTTWSVNPGGIGGSFTRGPGNQGGISGTDRGAGGMPSPGIGGYPIAQPSQIPPQYTRTTTLSAPEQALLTAKEGLGATAGQNAQTALQGWQLPTQDQNQQFGQNAMQAAYKEQTATMDPYWDQQQEQLDASLRNSGAHPGDPAYENAMRSFQANRASAYGQAENQAFGQGLAAQGQQISDINSAQGGQLSNFLSLIGQGAPSTGAAGGGAGGGSGQVGAPDIMSAFNNQYQGALAKYNAGVASQNADIGALGTLAAAFLLA